MRALAMGIVAGALLAPGLGAEGDLDVIQRAVRGTEAKLAGAPQAEAGVASKKGEPRWLRVRVTGKGGNPKRVSVNLPLAFVRAVGADWPLAFGRSCHGHSHACETKLSEVLESLESGQEIVEVDDENETVRVWVE